ncbi:hypothetical protein [Candidatus Methylomirabilis limnetica]|uniref:hypothetical protein n=1 Tax=Candidatus Methylomirabilis limnetica TaxID=2033718 RepID=UPI00129065F0|nr:hypothetical protein [Candidatus Methylomirabilis limnetica]
MTNSRHAEGNEPPVDSKEMSLHVMADGGQVLVAVSSRTALRSCPASSLSRSKSISRTQHLTEIPASEEKKAEVVPSWRGNERPVMRRLGGVNN